MRKDIAGTLRRAERFQIILIGEGVLVGAVAGLVVLLYRIALEHAGKWLNEVLEFAGQSAVYMAAWFAVLLVLAWIVHLLVRFEPMISGSGIPQLKGEMTGKFDQCWWKVLLAKFVGGFLCIFGGLALGREGPSIQLGAMVGKGISKSLDRGKTEERFLLTCGASAGLAAAFHAPLAGVMFSLEEIHKNFSVSVLVSVMTASLTADFLCSVLLGMDPVFRFEITASLPPAYYWMLLILGIILGVMGAFYNWFTLKAQSAYGKLKIFGNAALNGYAKLAVPFLCAGVLGFTCPQLLGSGHELIESMAAGEMTLMVIVLIFVGRFIFSAVSFGPGAPGGIFFPLLVLGGFIGGAFGNAAVELLGMDPVYVNNFVALAMAGYFAAIVRAPITGIILIFEMTGSLDQMLSLSVVSIVAYIIATLMKSEPIYESLLDRLWEKTRSENVKGNQRYEQNNMNIFNTADTNNNLNGNSTIEKSENINDSADENFSGTCKGNNLSTEYGVGEQISVDENTQAIAGRSKANDSVDNRSEETINYSATDNSYVDDLSVSGSDVGNSKKDIYTHVSNNVESSNLVETGTPSQHRPEQSQQSQQSQPQRPVRSKILSEYGIRIGSPADGSLISEINWPDNCLLVAIQRGEKELIPRGRTRLQAGDIIVIMADERDEVYVYERLERICQ